MTTRSSRLAPIAIFVFKRAAHTQRLLESLQTNPEFSESPVYIFADGARSAKEQADVDAVRQLVAEFAHPHKTVVLAPANQGLAKSITQGVTQLCAEYGHAIVVEDDLVVAPSFLSYMNTALARYADATQVMQISGHMFPVDLQASTDAVLMPVTTSWGWATWQRAWAHMAEAPAEATAHLASRKWRFQFDLRGTFPYARMLAQRLERKNHSWAIWWYYQVFTHSGLVLHPTRSLVNNEGFDGSGTHCADKDVVQMALQGTHVSTYPQVVAANTAAFKRYGRFLVADRGIKKYTFDCLWRLFFSTKLLHAR